MEPSHFERSAALRHAVYRDLLSMLPVASYRQTEIFVANLALARDAIAQAPSGMAKPAAWGVIQRFVMLRVSPDIAEARPPLYSAYEIADALAEKYGERIGDVPGFYFDDRWRLNLPTACALYGYRSEIGFYNGILCQPLDQTDKFFLLSSRGQGGASALRLSNRDRGFFESFKEPPRSGRAVGACVDLPGLRWNGRRFVEAR